MASRAVQKGGALFRGNSLLKTTLATTTRPHISRISVNAQWQMCRGKKFQPLTSSQRGAPKAPNALRPKLSFTKEGKLDLKDYPPEVFRRVIASHPDFFNRLSADQYYECAERFFKAHQQGDSPWSISFGPDDMCSPAVMHDIACILCLARPRGPHCAALWASASAMKHDPSTISLVKMLIDSGFYGVIRQLRPAEDRLRNLAAEGKNPNALVVEGELLAKRDQYHVAIAAFRRALKIGGDDFEWRPLCQMKLAEALDKAGEKEESQRIWESMSDENLPEVHEWLGKFHMSTDRDRAKQSFYTSGMLDNARAYTYLSEMALEDASQASDSTTSEDHTKWAMEWSRLANPRADI